MTWFRAWMGHCRRYGWAWALALVLGVALGLWMARHLPWGAWARTDSVAYIQAAQHLVQGRGLRVYTPTGRLEWLAHFPPFYPLSLAAWMKAGLPWHQATRWNAALTYGLWAALLYLTTLAVTRRVPESALLALSLALSPVLVQYLTGAMSEGWFFTWSLLALYGWWKTLVHRSLRAAFGAGVAAGLAVLTRYAGLFLAGGVVFLLLGLPREQRRRAVLAYLAPMVVMYGLWSLIMRLEGTGLAWRFPPPETWLRQAVFFVQRMPEVFWVEWLWFRPGELPRWLYLGAAWAFFALPGPLGLWAWLRWRRGDGPLTAAAEQAILPLWTPARRQRLFLWMALWAWGAWGYLAALYVAHMLRTPPADFYGRVAVPFFVLTWGALVMALMDLAGRVETRWVAAEPHTPEEVRHQNRWVWVGLWTWAFGLAFYFVGVRETQDILAVLQQYGHGYTRKGLHDPAFWQRVRAWPQDVVLISTEAYATMLWTGRFAAWPPEAYAPDQARGPLGSRRDDPWHEAFREGRGVLVHLKLARELWWEQRFDFLGRRALRTLLKGLPVCWKGSIGTLYFQGQAPPELCPDATPTP